MASQVIMDDGAESTISDHLRADHSKGTRGLTDDYLSDLHSNLHQAKREPRPEHAHPGQGGNDAGKQVQESPRPAKKARRDKRK